MSTVGPAVPVHGQFSVDPSPGNPRDQIHLAAIEAPSPGRRGLGVQPAGESGGRAMTAVPVAVRVFPGRAGQARQARRWVRALVVACCTPVADDAQLVAGELFANAVVHTRSGVPGGLVTVAVTADGVIHVHDQGADGRAPRAGLADALEDRGLLVVNGRGLGIVAAVCAGWGCRPAAECGAGGVGDPAARPGGCCTWCRLAPWPPERLRRVPGGRV